MPGNMNAFITTPFCTGYKHNSEFVHSYLGCAGGISPFSKSSAESLTALLYKETQRAYKIQSCEIQGGWEIHINEWSKPSSKYIGLR